MLYMVYTVFPLCAVFLSSYEGQVRGKVKEILITSGYEFRIELKLY
jgi:hypothetical protein